MAVSTDVQLKFSVKESRSNDLGDSKMVHLLELARGYGSGTAASTFDVVYSDTASIASGTPLSLDLLGSLTSVLTGQTVSFVKLCGVIVKNKSTTSGQYLTLGGGSNALSGFSGKADPSGVFVWFSPIDAMAPVAGTGDILQIASATGTISCDILLLGRSA